MEDLFENLSKAKALLIKGDVVAIPTETVYGLAASIYSEEGINKIFKLKERPSFDPLIVHIARLSQAKEVVKEWTALTHFLARKFWPGPLTLILKKHPSLNSKITAGLDTVGLRMPRHPMTRHLIDYANIPLAAPSANKFGKTSPTRAEHVKGFFDDVFILDGGPCEVGLESSVIEVDKNKIKILRPGFVTREKLERALEGWPTPFEIEETTSSISPGHLQNHYQPAIPLVITKEDPSVDIINKIQKALKIKGTKFAKLELTEDPVLEARKLYHSLHSLSASNANFILVQKNPKNSTKNEWTPIWDRLQKASSLDLTVN